MEHKFSENLDYNNTVILLKRNINFIEQIYMNHVSLSLIYIAYQRKSRHV